MEHNKLSDDRLDEIERTSKDVEDGVYTILSDDLHSMAVELIVFRKAIKERHATIESAK